MKIAILETGRPPGDLTERFGAYPDMFRKLLGADRVGPTYDVARGEYPARPEDQGAYLLTGSPAGVYDPLPWIAPLKSFLRNAKGKVRLVGVCFGHQIMAEAFGGEVAKSEKGWGIGLQHYRLAERAPWMDGTGEIAVPVSHQDQVIERPPESRRIGGSGFCDIGILAYEDQPAISFQFHPEFEPDFAAALIESRRDRPSGADAAIASLRQPDDRARVGQWIKSFVDSD